MRVDIWSDIACPFCYLGKTTLERTLEAFEHRDEVEVVYHSFLLSPELPVDYPGDIHDMLARKTGMARAQANMMNAGVAQKAAGQGLEWHMDDIVVTNLAAAHRLIHFAKSQGKQHEMVDRLYRAYFTEGKHLGKVDVLASLADEVGLDPEHTREVLESDQFAADLQEDIAQARRMGANGVPLFVFNDKYGISGAQSEEVFRDALEKVWREEHPLETIGSDPGPGDGCVDGVCAVPTAPAPSPPPR